MDKQTDRQTDKQTNITDYPIVAEGAFKNHVQLAQLTNPVQRDSEHSKRHPNMVQSVKVRLSCICQVSCIFKKSKKYTSRNIKLLELIVLVVSIWEDCRKGNPSKRRGQHLNIPHKINF